MSERIIKFRAWSYTQKKMLDRVLAGPGDPCSIVWSEERGDWVHFDAACGVIMQFTGLHDCTGKEIYEGDIMTYDAIGKDIKGIVTWIPTATGFSLLTPGKESAYFLHTSWEVIGNIYEHSDLIPQKK